MQEKRISKSEDESSGRFSWNKLMEGAFLEPNGNFYLTPDGMTHIYGRYEIGPYVSGIVRVTVPWEELKGLLR